MILHLHARAKLNLVLRIVGRRADGYHLLETLLHPLELCDELWAERRPGERIRLHVESENARAAVSAGSDNLVVRAAERFAAAAGVDQGFRFHLHKRIPAGAGLGGGSSDAAAALRLCNALCGGVLAPSQLHQLACSLGADVPFFLAGGSQWGRGIGDELEFAPAVPPKHFVLMIPAFGCPTAEVYKTFAAELNAGRQQASIRALGDHPHRDSELGDRLVNDLEVAAERVRPELAELRLRVAGKGFPQVRMTGSGSTLFLAFDQAHEVTAAMQALAELRASGVEFTATRSAPAGIDSPAPGRWPPSAN